MDTRNELIDHANQYFVDFCIELSGMVDDGVVSNSAAKTVFKEMLRINPLVQYVIGVKL